MSTSPLFRTSPWGVPDDCRVLGTIDGHAITMVHTPSNHAAASAVFHPTGRGFSELRPVVLSGPFAARRAIVRPQTASICPRLPPD